MIQKCVATTYNRKFSYYIISNAKTNKSWLVEYNTTLSGIIHYALGYINALDINYTIYLHESLSEQDFLLAASYAHVERITETEFKLKQDILMKVDGQ
jgi:hypothetical protein